jgi:hypothetical protein
MNNIIKKGEVLPNWRQKSSKNEKGSHPEITTLLMKNPQEFGASSGMAITEVDLKTIAPCWYPVHAMGYNFLKSNADSAKVIADRIRGLVAGYEKCGFKCKEVILVTHSMGGLLARALIHPNYGNLANDKNIKILGIYHNVMPSTGAAGAYKRMRFGFKEKSGLKADVEAKILGIDGKHATAILANAPAPLEMMPGTAYGSNWLKVIDAKDQVLWSWPSEKQTALESIYLQPASNWWRLINPLWVNPANIPDGRGGGLENVKKRLTEASIFLKSIGNSFHNLTYASYCESKEYLSYGEIVFKVIDGMNEGLFNFSKKDQVPTAEKWKLLSDDAKGTLTVQAGTRVLKLKLQSATASGDDTVPATLSAQHIKGNLFRHGQKEGTGYKHQDSYADKKVLASMIYSIVQIAKKADWA